MSSLEYTSFLIRLWREPAAEGDSATEAALAVQVEHIPGGERRYFTSLEQLFAYLRMHVDELSGQSDRKSGRPDRGSSSYG